MIEIDFVMNKHENPLLYLITKINKHLMNL